MFLERGTLHADSHTLLFENQSGAVEIPVAQAAVLFLEPGVKVTHAAIKQCADQGTLLLWVGEAGVRVYASGEPGGQAGVRILEQARLHLHKTARLAVARRLHERMFGDRPPPANDIEQMRGLEGSWVRRKYQELAAINGLEWTSRESMPKHVQDALGYATATLYGLSEAVILAAGYSPSIGFIHSGDRRSFVFDLADTLKFRTVIPIAFAIASGSACDVRSATRRACRDHFRRHKLIDDLFDNLEYALEPSCE